MIHLYLLVSQNTFSLCVFYYHSRINVTYLIGYSTYRSSSSPLDFDLSTISGPQFVSLLLWFVRHWDWERSKFQISSLFFCHSIDETTDKSHNQHLIQYISYWWKDKVEILFWNIVPEEEFKRNLEYFKVPNGNIESIRSKLAMKIFDEYENILKGVYSIRFTGRSDHGDTPTLPGLGPTTPLINSLTS